MLISVGIYALIHKAIMDRRCSADIDQLSSAVAVLQSYPWQLFPQRSACNIDTMDWWPFRSDIEASMEDTLKLLALEKLETSFDMMQLGPQACSRASGTSYTC